MGRLRGVSWMSDYLFLFFDLVLVGLGMEVYDIGFMF